MGDRFSGGGWVKFDQGRRPLRSLLVFLFVGLTARALTSQVGSWTVRPEWVRAHEEFLASDVLAGRGSATRDEQIAATYVASEFMAYGLKPAPGMSGYLQTAMVFAPELDGHASLKAGAVVIDEGKGFQLLYSSGTSVSGVLKKVQREVALPAKLPAGTILLVSEGMDFKELGEMLRAARKAGAAGVLVRHGKGATALAAQWGGGTRVPVRLTDAVAEPRATLAALDAAGMEQMQTLGDGAAISIVVHTVPQPAKATYNAVGYLQGTDAAAGTILLTAHLDHLGVGKPVKGDAIYNGANDDAAGTTAVLELAHALASGSPLRRSVLFVCYGSEEAGELGSEYFGRHSPVPIKDLVANLEFEMIGTQDPKMPKDTLLLTGWDRSDLGPALKAHGARLGPDPYPEQHFFERSDNYQLALEGVVAHTAAGYGTPSTYHQPDDDLAHLDLHFMTAAIQSLIEPVRWLAGSNFKPAWTKDGQPHR